MYGFSVSEQCKWRLHVPRLQDGAEKSFKWPKERGSVINVTTQTKRVWHGTTLAAFWDIVRDGFLRNNRPAIDNGTGVWLAKEVMGCEYSLPGNNPRVRLQVEVPDAGYHHDARTKVRHRPDGKTQWLYDEKWIVIRKIVFMGDCSRQGQDDFYIPVLQA